MIGVCMSCIHQVKIQLEGESNHLSKIKKNRCKNTIIPPQNKENKQKSFSHQICRSHDGCPWKYTIFIIIILYIVSLQDKDDQCSPQSLTFVVFKKFCRFNFDTCSTISLAPLKMPIA